MSCSFVCAGRVDPADARAAARANTALRRDYGASPTNPVMSKRAERALREASSSHANPLPSAPGIDGGRRLSSPFRDVDGRSASPPLQASVQDRPWVRADSPQQVGLGRRLAADTGHSIVERMDGGSAIITSLNRVHARGVNAAVPLEVHGVEAGAGLGSSFQTSQESHRGPGTGEELGYISARPVNHTAPEAVQATSNGLGCGSQTNPAAWTPRQPGMDPCPDIDPGLGSDDDGGGAFWEDLETAPAYGDGRMQDRRCLAPQGQVQPGPKEEGWQGHSGAGNEREAKQAGGRVILHVDVVAFYCSVERLDDPTLAGLPVVVTQFNHGGFVSVSHEVRDLP
jgi:hypothetical protein